MDSKSQGKSGLKPFVLLATAPSPAACSQQLLECFHLTIPLVQRYSDAELTAICQRMARGKGILVSPDVAALVSSASRDSPHEVELLVGKLTSLGKTGIALEDVTQLMSSKVMSSCLCK